MEEIKELVDRLIKKAEENNVPMMIAFGNGKTFMKEFSTTNSDTPDRIKRARTAFVSAPGQSKSVMEFD